MNSKNCIIIHGCPGTKEETFSPATRKFNGHWMPWTKRTLIAAGIPTETPLMPAPWAPVYEHFRSAFEKYPVDENTILVGHSCGCAFLVRWLGETKRKIAKLILVAPWKVSKPGDEGRDAFYHYAIDPTIKERVGEIVMFTADNESDAGKESLQEYHNALGGTIIELKDRGHYIYDHMGTEEFPELVRVVMKE